MTYRDIVADMKLCFFVGAMQNRAILDIDLLAHADAIDIATNHCREPNRTACAHLDVADHSSVFSQKTIWTNLGFEAPTCFYECHKGKGSKMRLVFLYCRPTHVKNREAFELLLVISLKTIALVDNHIACNAGLG